METSVRQGIFSCKFESYLRQLPQSYTNMEESYFCAPVFRLLLLNVPCGNIPQRDFQNFKIFTRIQCLNFLRCVQIKYILLFCHSNRRMSCVFSQNFFSDYGSAGSVMPQAISCCLLTVETRVQFQLSISVIFDKVALTQALTRELRYAPVSIGPPKLHNHMSLFSTNRMSIPYPALRQVLNLFQSQFSTQCDLLLPLSISRILSFL